MAIVPEVERWAAVLLLNRLTGSCLSEQMARPITFQVLIVSPFQMFFGLIFFFLSPRKIEEIN